MRGLVPAPLFLPAEKSYLRLVSLKLSQMSARSPVLFSVGPRVVTGHGAYSSQESHSCAPKLNLSLKGENRPGHMRTHHCLVVSVCASPIYVGESPLDLSVSAQRPVCVGSKHGGIMGDEVKGQGSRLNAVCVACKCLCVLEP